MPFVPFSPPAPRERFESLDLSTRISRGNGTWLELNDGALLRIAEGSFAEESVAFRRVSASNAFLEGEVTVQALRGNVVRPLNIWVSATDHYRLASTLAELKELFGQLRFQVVRTIENVSETFDCSASDYSVASDRPLLHARMAQLKVSLVTHPDSVLVEEI